MSEESSENELLIMVAATMIATRIFPLCQHADGNHSPVKMLVCAAFIISW